MQNVVINMCEKFHYDRLRNDRALGNGKSDNNKWNNVGSASGPVAGSKMYNSNVVERAFHLYSLGVATCRFSVSWKA